MNAMHTLRMTLNIYQSNLIQNSSRATYSVGVDCISGSLYKSFCDSNEKEPSVAELESGRVVPRLDSSTKRGWLISTAHCSSHPGRSPGQPHCAASYLGKCRLHSLRSTVQYLLREITYLYTFWLRDPHATSIQGQAICFC